MLTGHKFKTKQQKKKPPTVQTQQIQTLHCTPQEKPLYPFQTKKQWPAAEWGCELEKDTLQILYCFSYDKMQPAILFYCSGDVWPVISTWGNIPPLTI